MQEWFAAANGDDGGSHVRRADRCDGTSPRWEPGFEKSSNSLQYVQARLQRRMGMIWTSKRMPRRGEPFRDHPEFSQLAVRREHFPANFFSRIHWAQDTRSEQLIGCSHDYAIGDRTFCGDCTGRVSRHLRDCQAVTDCGAPLVSSAICCGAILAVVPVAASHRGLAAAYFTKTLGSTDMPSRSALSLFSPGSKTILTGMRCTTFT